MTVCVVPARWANSACVRPAFRRRFATSIPRFILFMARVYLLRHILSLLVMSLQTLSAPVTLRLNNRCLTSRSPCAGPSMGSRLRFGKTVPDQSDGPRRAVGPLGGGAPNAPTNAPRRRRARLSVGGSCLTQARSEPRYSRLVGMGRAPPHLVGALRAFRRVLGPWWMDNPGPQPESCQPLAARFSASAATI
jgi:hypothetical protein